MNMGWGCILSPARIHYMYMTSAVMAAALVLLSLLLLDQSPYSTADAPSVKLMNAAKDMVL